MSRRAGTGADTERGGKHLRVGRTEIPHCPHTGRGEAHPQDSLPAGEVSQHGSPGSRYRYPPLVGSRYLSTSPIPEEGRLTLKTLLNKTRGQGIWNTFRHRGSIVHSFGSSSCHEDGKHWSVF
jgi:hypothetical protein